MAAPDDPEITLAMAYAPAAVRPALALLWRLDARLGAVQVTTPAIGQIKLAWWREALARLDSAPPPPEPLLGEVAALLIGRVSGAELGEIAMGWSALIEPEDMEAALVEHARERGARLFAMAARLLGGEADAAILRAGEGWALADIAALHPAVLPLARDRLADVGARRWPVALRPLGMIALLARRDALHGAGRKGAPGRMLRMMWHRLSGR